MSCRQILLRQTEREVTPSMTNKPKTKCPTIRASREINANYLQLQLQTFVSKVMCKLGLALPRRQYMATSQQRYNKLFKSLLDLKLSLLTEKQAILMLVACSWYFYNEFRFLVTSRQLKCHGIYLILIFKNPDLTVSLCSNLEITSI